jgi:hypothetical protein
MLPEPSFPCKTSRFCGQRARSRILRSTPAPERYEFRSEKFQADLAQLSEKDIALLRALATSEEHEFTPAPFARKFQYEYFRRLTERGLLIRAGRAQHKLYHPLFREFLRQTK